MSVELTATDALGLWHRVTLEQVRGEGADLSLRQLAILLQVYLLPPPHTVRGLAATLEVTKPVVTRALDTMGQLGLVERVRDEKDRRSVVVKRTVTGSLYLERLADLIRMEGRR
jgi:DNA-binding MarR family transcriptional regulator